MRNSIHPVKVFAIRDEVRPVTGSADAAAIDLRVNLSEREPYILLQPGESRLIGSGLHMEIPVGWCGIIIPRSGMGSKGLHIKNVTGLIDADYRGEIQLGLVNNGSEEIIIERFERVCQMVIVPHYPHVLEFVESVDELSETDRGTGGFGHSGKQ